MPVGVSNAGSRRSARSLRLGEQHRVAAGVMRREQPADEPDRGLEHRDLAVDVEIEIGLHPVDAGLEPAVEPHRPERVERLDQAQAEMAVLEREAGGAAADRLDLVLAPGLRPIRVPRPGHLRLHVVGERMPLRRAAIRRTRGRSRQRRHARPRQRASHHPATSHPHRIHLRQSSGSALRPAGPSGNGRRAWDGIRRLSHPRCIDPR